MKSFAPIFFTFLYLVAMARPVLPVAEFIINQDYIAEFLCINTDKPELACNGKCYLMQMLEEQENEKRQNLPPIDLSEYPIGFVNITFIALKNASEIPITESFSYRENYSYLFGFSNFHPPTVYI